MGIPQWADRTPRLNSNHRRGEEIQKWMDEHGVKKEDIVIFDDDCDMLHLTDRLVKTDFYFGGLCYKHIKQAWEILK